MPPSRSSSTCRPHEPCLALHRRSWSQGQVVTVATLIYPASRYALHSRYKTPPQGKDSL